MRLIRHLLLTDCPRRVIERILVRIVSNVGGVAVARSLLRVMVAMAATQVLVGCAGTWDTITSRRFRKEPFHTMFKSEDPMTVMRTSPEGDQRAKAMRKLKEPALSGNAQDQEQAIELLSQAATSDPSPVVRVAAIDALGRFKDERAVPILTAAYHQSSGAAIKPKAVDPATITQVGAGGRPLGMSLDRMSLTGPTGFAPEVVSMVRSRAVEALANTGRAEAVPIMTRIAAGTDDSAADRDTRIVAVRGLTKLRVPESVAALAKVLAAEKGKDPALAGRAHESLVNLTGQSMPAEPEKWETLVRSGNVTIAPPPTGIQQVGAILSGN